MVESLNTESNIIQSIYHEVLNQNIVKTNRINRQFLMKGKSSDFAIDLLWEFQFEKNNHIAIIEVKGSNSLIDKNELILYKKIIDDLPTNYHFFYVSNLGFTEGAIDFANKNKIFLYSLLKDEKNDENSNYVKNIDINMVLFAPNSRLINFGLDKEWLKEERIKLNIEENEQIPFNISGYTNEIILFNKKDEKITTLYDLIYSLFPKELSEFKPTKTIFNFQEDTFIHTQVEKFPRVKLNYIEFEIWVDKIVKKLAINTEGIVSFILQSIK